MVRKFSNYNYLFFLILILIPSVSAVLIGGETGAKITTINNDTFYINGSNINATSTTCAGGQSFISYNNSTGAFTCASGGSADNVVGVNVTGSSTKTLNITLSSGANITATFTDNDGSEVDPWWTSNFTLYNSTWTSTFNSTYNAYNSTGLIKDWNSTGYIKDWNSTGLIKNWWVDVMNGTIAKITDLANYVLISNIVSLVGNWSADKSSYYLVTNPYSYYNSTTIPAYLTAEVDPYWSGNQSSYYNSTYTTTNITTANTSMKTYVDAQDSLLLTRANWTTQNTSIWTGIDAKLPLAGGIMTGNINISNQNITTIGSGKIFSNSSCIKLMGATSLIEVC